MDIIYGTEGKATKLVLVATLTSTSIAHTILLYLDNFINGSAPQVLFITIILYMYYAPVLQDFQ
jgi:hypothetical protein